VSAATAACARALGRTTFAWLATLAIAALAQANAGRVFVGCPVYRDTDSGPKSGCWLVIDPASGIRYDISLGRSKPQIGHEVLVEGRVEASLQGDRIALRQTPCGGVVLAPVVDSVLPAACPGFMLPAEGYPGRRFVLDRKLVLAPADVTEPLPRPPYRARTWSIEFTYGSDFLQYQYSEIILDRIGRYIRASHPRRIEVTGYAVTEPYTVSGHRIAEQPQLARARARMVAVALARLGAAPGMLHVDWGSKPPPLSRAAGLAQSSRRRVDIRLSY
jgi:hypothetical protein